MEAAEGAVDGRLRRAEWLCGGLLRALALPVPGH
jgi:hypothetical protein